MSLAVGTKANHPYIRGPVEVVLYGKTPIGWPAVFVKDENGQVYTVTNTDFLTEIKEDNPRPVPSRLG